MTTPAFSVGQKVTVPILKITCIVNRIDGDLVECFWPDKGGFKSFSFDKSLLAVSTKAPKKRKATRIVS